MVCFESICTSIVMVKSHGHTFRVGDADRILGDITSAIRDFTGETAQFDDITLVVVKRDVD